MWNKRELLFCHCLGSGGHYIQIYTEFELLAVKQVSRRVKSVVAAYNYRSPGTVTSAFTEQLSYLFDHLVLLDSQFIVLSDFNVPGITTGQLDQRNP